MIVIGVDIDPQLISSAIHQMHKVINDEECANVIKSQMTKHFAGLEDQQMLTDEERVRETKLGELMAKVN